MDPAPRWRAQPLDPGTPVAVYNRSLSAWTSGFQIATSNNRRYRLRRVSDRALLPGEFTEGDLRSQRDTAEPRGGHR